MEQAKLIQQLDEKDRNIVFNIIDTMLAKRKFKGFFLEECGGVVKCSFVCHFLHSNTVFDYCGFEVKRITKELLYDNKMLYSNL